MRILVTGGTGFVGQHLGQALLNQGHAVALMGRDFRGSTALLASGAQAIVADLRDHVAVAAACSGVDVVYHVGALSAPWGKAIDFQAINVGGTANVLAGCRLHNVSRLVFVSSPSAFFDGRDHRLLTEQALFPRRYTSVYALTKASAEVLVLQANLEGLDAVILRPKAIFGPGDTTLLPRIVAAARQGRLPQVGNGCNLVDITYIDNVIQALLLALDVPPTVWNTFFITNDEHVVLWDVIKLVLRRLNIQVPLRPVPLRLMLLVAALMELRARFTGREPLLTRYSAAILGRTQTYDITKAKQELGYRPLVTVAEGIERTMAELRMKNGELRMKQG